MTGDVPRAAHAAAVFAGVLAVASTTWAWNRALPPMPLPAPVVVSERDAAPPDFVSPQPIAEWSPPADAAYSLFEGREARVEVVAETPAARDADPGLRFIALVGGPGRWTGVFAGTEGPVRFGSVGTTFRDVGLTVVEFRADADRRDATPLVVLRREAEGRLFEVPLEAVAPVRETQGL